VWKQRSIVNYKTKFYWKYQANIKWKEIQPDIKELQMLHKDYFQDLFSMLKNQSITLRIVSALQNEKQQMKKHCISIYC